MKITQCRISHLANPLGIDLGKPVFSFAVENGEDRTAKSRIRILEEGKTVHDTGWQEDTSGTIPLPLSLKPRAAYQWKVSCISGSGEKADSAWQHFETGKMTEPWRASWITCSWENDRSPVFQKAFSLPKAKKVTRARLYICGLGLFVVGLDGRRVSRNHLMPGCVDYDSSFPAWTLDLTENLQNKDDKSEEHTLQITLGNGWYRGRFGFTEREKKPFALLAELHLLYEDGTEEALGSGKDWDVCESSILSSGIYDGEIRDDTAPVHRGKAQLLTEPMPPVHDTFSLPVVETEELSPEFLPADAGEYLLDLHQNFAGIFRLHVHEPYGTRVLLRFGELLEDGKLCRRNLRSAKQEYTYTSDGKEHILTPEFTYYGYRYVRISGISHLTQGDFTGIPLCSGFARTGFLQTGVPEVNQLLSNVLWGMRSNFLDNPTDCPQRDERMGWTGDAAVFSGTALDLGDTAAFFRKYLYEMHGEQKKRDGAVPETVPAFGTSNTGALWGDAVCTIPWNVYLATGDATVLEENYEGMLDWIRYIQRIDGEDRGWRKVRQYGDWLALDSLYPEKGIAEGGTDKGFLADVYYRKSILIAAKSARILKKKESEGLYCLAQKIRDRILNDFYAPSGRCCIDTQTGLALSIMEGLGDRKMAGERLSELLLCNKNHLKTGFAGTPVLLPALSAAGCSDQAYQILLSHGYPGWMYEIDHGATTIWERWDSVSEDGTLSSTGMNSLNHYAYGSVAEWLFTHAAGLQTMEDHPGYQMARIAPKINARLKNLDLSLATAAGTYHIFWKVTDLHHAKVSIQIPTNAMAEVVLPGIHGMYAGGEHAFEIESVKPLRRVYTPEDDLKTLYADEKSREILYDLVPELDSFLFYTMSYPLRETLTNLGYSDRIEAFGKALREEAEEI